MGMKERQESNYIGAADAAILLGLSTHRVSEMCRLGVFKTAFQPGVGRRAEWRILRNEVSQRKLRTHARKPQSKVLENK